MDVKIHSISFHLLGKPHTNADKSFQYLLIRLLLGHASIHQAGAIAKQTTDYSLLPPQPQSATPAKAISKYLIDFDVGLNTASFIRKTLSDNRSFYKELLLEFSNFYLQTSKSSHVSAFLFLYRAMERMSYSIPLLYVSTQTDYFGTFKELKKHLAQETEGEIGFFKKFITTGKLFDSTLLDVEYDIAFSSTHSHQNDYHQITQRIFDKFESNDPGHFKFKLKFKNTIDLLATLRNRFFHARTGDGRNNISITEMHYPDEYFECVNPIFCSFLSMVVLTSIAAKYQK